MSKLVLVTLKVSLIFYRAEDSQWEASILMCQYVVLGRMSGADEPL